MLIDTKTVEAWDETALCNYREVVSAISQALEDPWPATVDVVTGRDHSIIHAPSDDVTTYLKHIDLLWQLGAKARTPRREEIQGGDIMRRVPEGSLDVAVHRAR